MPNTILPPLMIERGYDQLIRSVLRYQIELIASEVNDGWARMVEIAKPVRSDELGGDWSAAVFALFGRVADAMTARLLTLPPQISSIRSATEASHRRQWMRIVRRHYGVDVFKNEPWLVPLATAWERQNIQLITKISDDSRSRLQGQFLEAVRNGTSGRQMTSVVQEQLGIDRNRATFIARDQISKLNGEITQERQQDLGVRKYRWRTSQDERVRPSHRANSGKTFSWNKPPTNTGHPGRDYRCRCTAEAIFPDIEAILA